LNRRFGLFYGELNGKTEAQAQSGEQEKTCPLESAA
jgi:hypothetical protein